MVVVARVVIVIVPRVLASCGHAIPPSLVTPTTPPPLQEAESGDHRPKERRGHSSRESGGGLARMEGKGR
jgi:hypothetical protein